MLESRIVDESVKVLADHGVTARLTPDRGQMIMELYWWNKRKISKTTELSKQDACLTTASIGFFPGVGAHNPENIVGETSGGLISNVVLVGIPTLSSMLYGPLMDPVDGDYPLCQHGLFGNYRYLDRKNPKVLKEYVERQVEEKIEDTPIRLMDFEIEIGGNVFRGENGIAYVGTVVGNKPELDVKLLSFLSPADGISSNAVSAACGGKFPVKVPAAADIMAENETKRLQELAVAQRMQAEREAATSCGFAASVRRCDSASGFSVRGIELNGCMW